MDKCVCVGKRGASVLALIQLTELNTENVATKTMKGTHCMLLMAQ